MKIHVPSSRCLMPNARCAMHCIRAIPAGRRTTNNEQRTTIELVLGAAGICDAERDGSMGWSMDLTDGAGTGRVRKPRIRVTKALRNLSQAPQSALKTNGLADFGARAELVRRIAGPHRTCNRLMTGEPHSAIFPGRFGSLVRFFLDSPTDEIVS